MIHDHRHTQRSIDSHPNLFGSSPIVRRLCSSRNPRTPHDSITFAVSPSGSIALFRCRGRKHLRVSHVRSRNSDGFNRSSIVIGASHRRTADSAWAACYGTAKSSTQGRYCTYLKSRESIFVEYKVMRYGFSQESSRRSVLRPDDAPSAENDD